MRNYVDGVVDGDHTDEDVTVEMSFAADGQIASLTARNPATGDQVTRYVYGTTLADSAVARADLLRAEIYPDSDDTANPLGNGPDGVYDRVEYTYNRQGQRVTKTDQNGTLHTYYYDGLGRLQDDCVTTLAEGIDGTVRRIGVEYEVRGLPEKISSYDSQDSIVNQVQLAYNAFGLLITDYQEHAGAVNLSSSSRVGYLYSDGSANHARRVATVYPNGRVLLYKYDPGIDDALSRVTRIADDAGSGPGHPLAEYARLGLNTFVQTDYPEPQLRCDLAHGTGDDPFAGLDRFGRIVDLRWWSNTSIADDVERIRHGYDRAGNRRWRECPVAESFGKHFDELYSYDRVDQLVALQRGDLNEEKTGLVGGTKTFAEDWLLDMTGNWPQYRQDTGGDGTWDLSQTRSHNAANEIVAINGSLGHFAHDAAGNMTRIPRSPVPPGGGSQGEDGLDVLHFHFAYDAWNRLVRVSLGESPDTVAEYQYDGRHYRILKKVYGPHGYPPATRHSYYSDQWQVLEERVGEAETADRQFVWGVRYIDDLVLRDRDSMGYATLDERLYALQDPNWNVTAIVGPDGSAVERYSYRAYGHAQSLTPAFTTRGQSLYAWETLFTGRRLDRETGDYDYRARLFGPDMGRFRSRDPIESDLNPYRYCGNMPTNATDPSGLEDSSVGTRTNGCSITIYVGHNTSVLSRLDTLYPGFSAGKATIPIGTCIMGVCCGFRFRPQDRPNQMIYPRVPGSSKTCSLQWFLQEYYAGSAIPAPGLLPLREVTPWLVGHESLEAAIKNGREAASALCGGRAPSGRPGAECPKCDTVTVSVECDAAAASKFGAACGRFEVQACRAPGF